MQPPLFRLLIVLGLASALAPGITAQTLTVPAPPAVGQQSSAAAPIDPQAEARVIACLEARKFADALTGAQAILAASPDSPKANKLVGVVLLDQQKSSDALPYFQRALQLAPNDPMVHGLLLQAYAESGDKAHRDEQRAILRGFHSDGKHPEFARIPAYLIETIPIANKVIQATEFYEPSGEFHFYYRFNIFDAKGHILGFIALESDDADQALYAQQHSKQAAVGERRFSLDGYSQSADGRVSQALYTFFNGEPSYDDVRALVIRLVQEGKSPIAAATTRASE